MARFELKKGDKFKLGKGAELEAVQIDLTWQATTDLDAVAFCLNDDGVISEDADFVFYNSSNRFDPETFAPAPYSREKYGSKNNWKGETIPGSFDGAVMGSADDPGAEDDDASEESGETMHVNLGKVRPEVTEIVFGVTIYDESAKETFKDVRNAQIIITNEDTGDVLCRYDLKEKFSTETAVVAGALVLNEDGDWEFEAIGRGYDGGLQTLVDMYA